MGYVCMCMCVYVCVEVEEREREREGERTDGTLVSKETQEEQEEATRPGMPPSGHGQSDGK